MWHELEAVKSARTDSCAVSVYMFILSYLGESRTASVRAELKRVRAENFLQEPAFQQGKQRVRPGRNMANCRYIKGDVGKHGDERVGRDLRHRSRLRDIAVRREIV